MPQDPDETFDELDLAVFECLETMEESGPLGLERLLAGRPHLSDSLRRRLAALGGAGLLGPEPGATPPERFGEFRLLEPLGGGGMGNVWLARQDSLEREVALKVMRADQQYFPEIRQRFAREAATLSLLRHPGIVPVYAVGQVGGVPYLVMERVRGATLAEVLDELAGRDPAALRGADLGTALAASLRRKGLVAEAERLPRFEGTWPEACARVVEQVARALEHAHERGVLHRDVKPSNVLIDSDGRARLFDFGLARADGSADITATGTPVGTLPYMAPEQVGGRGMDTRTDVYGLGALMHELLTLRHLHAAADELGLRAAILAGAVRGPRTVNAQVPRDLESICLQALEREPARRYASALALADDLRDFLEHQPVRARPVGAWVHARRWCRRHPTRAVALLAGLTLAIGLPSALAVQRGLAAERIRLALDQARDEGERAEANLDRALEAVVSVMGEVADEELQQVPGMDAARERLVERSLRVLEELMPQRSADPELAWRRGTLLCAHAGLLDLLGRTREAVAEFEQGIELLRPRAADGNAEHVLALAGALGDLAARHTRLGDAEASLALEREALARLEPLAGGSADPRALLYASRLRRNLGNSLMRRGRYEEALAELALARTAAERLCAVADGPESRFELARCAREFGIVHQDHGDVGPALEAYGQAWPAYVARLEDPRPTREALYGLGSFAADYSILLGESERFGEQAEVADVGVRACERLVRDHPHVDEYRKLLSDALDRAAVALVAASRRDAALEVFRRGLELSRETAAARPDDAQAALDAARATSNLAVVLVELGRALEALPLAEEAAAGFERLRREASWLGGLDSYTVRARLVEAQARLGAHEYPDAEALEALISERAEREPQVWVVLAAVMAAAIPVARSDPSLDAGQRERTAEEHGELSLLYLERALELGYSTPEHLARSPEFDVLRDHPGFLRILASLRRE
jgi:hypothetical protein